MRKTFIFLMLWLCAFGVRGQVSRAEYFIDSDPGIGAATRISAAPVTVQNAADRLYQSLTVNIPLTAVSDGFHTLGVRARNANGWSQTMRHNFVRAALPSDGSSDVVRSEYFIDSDPGLGKATAINAAASNGAYSFAVDLAAIADGVHTLYVRTLNKYGRWSQTMRRSFVKAALPTDGSSDVLRSEFFIDADPGLGKATAVNATASNGAYSFTVDITDIADGVHILYVRTQNKYGRWSQTMRRSFVKTELPGELPLYIRYIEYTFDSAPRGTGTPVAFAPGTKSIEFVADLNGLSGGEHTLYVRARKRDNTWETLATHIFTVLIDGELIEVTGVSLNKTAATLNTGATETLTATVTPANATDKSVVWTSSNPAVATVAGGVVTAISAGSASITATTANGGYTASCEITVSATTVTPEVLSVTASPSPVSVQKGTSQQFISVVAVTGGAAQTVSWSLSGNASSATTISATGLLTVSADETATTLTVTATSTVNATKSGTATVTVSATPVVTYTVTFNPVGGTVTPTSAIVTSGFAVGTLPTPSKPDHIFDGWFTAANDSGSGSSSSGTKWEATTIVTENTTLYAKWTAENVTGVETQLSASVHLYPNPFNGSIQLKGAEGSVLNVITVTGAVVHTQKVVNPDETINLEKLPAGLYFFRLEKDGKVKTFKAVKIQ
ncbi:hypothetical protein FACS189430_00900 [Bacteroidia bacterium]|nr:hypothetical protein FACS189430_00900 [Bacteroidia bacterium]